MPIAPIYLIALMCVLNHSAFAGSRMVLSLYALQLGANPFMIGVLMALYAICPMLLAVYVGRLADRIGGHLVSGHVDGVGEVLAFEPVGESTLLRVRAPQDLARYIARKGSITVNGVSLTVNSVDGQRFSINLIPHTIAVTTLKHLAAGAKVNLEIDLIARYVERLLSMSGEVQK